MLHPLILAMCAFPISFEEITTYLIVDGSLLIAATLILFLFSHFLKMKRLSYWLIMGVSLVGSIWSFIIAFMASRNYLICAGVPGASTDLVRRAEENYNTLMIFQTVGSLTSLITAFLLAIVGITITYAIRNYRNYREALSTL